MKVLAACAMAVVLLGGLAGGIMEAGVVGGPKRISDRIKGYATDAYELDFQGGEQAIVELRGDGDTDLDLYVYDANGQLVASDTRRTDQCLATWTPRATGTFTVKVKNLGSIHNRYVLRTN